MGCRPNEMIDATVKGGMARLINHSCEPNCATEKWIVEGELRVGIFAIQHIPAGTEITYHYRLDWNRGAKVRQVRLIMLPECCCNSVIRLCCIRACCGRKCLGFV